MPASTLAALAGARWPRLATLVLWFGAESKGARYHADDVAALLAAPGFSSLRHLELHALEPADALIERLLEAPLLSRLRSLEVSESLLSDAGVAALTEQADRLKHLQSVRITEVPASQASLEALAARLPSLEAERGSAYDSVAHFVGCGEVDPEHAPPLD